MFPSKVPAPIVVEASEPQESTTTTTASSPQSESNSNMMKEVKKMVVISIILPLVIYSVISNYTSQTVALALSGVPPLLDSVFQIIRYRRVDVVAGLVIASTILAIIVTVVNTDPKIFLIRDSFTTIFFGVAFLGSILLCKENLIFFYKRQYAGKSEQAIAECDRKWQIPGVQRTTSRLCVLLGVGMLLEAVARIVLIFHLSTDTMVYLSPVLMVATFAILIACTVLYVKHVKKQTAVHTDYHEAV